MLFWYVLMPLEFGQRHFAPWWCLKKRQGLDLHGIIKTNPNEIIGIDGDIHCCSGKTSGSRKHLFRCFKQKHQRNKHGVLRISRHDMATDASGFYSNLLELIGSACNCSVMPLNQVWNIDRTGWMGLFQIHPHTHIKRWMGGPTSMVSAPARQKEPMRSKPIVLCTSAERFSTTCSQYDSPSCDVIRAKTNRQSVGVQSNDFFSLNFV